MSQVANRTDKIAVVDDDARIRDLLRRYLSQEGFEVIVAEDAKALSRIMLRDTIDLIVLDLMMPGEDGLSVCRRLRAAGDKTPIIMLTAKGEDVDRIVGLEVGADDYLGKPFNPRELLARVHAVLRRRPPQEAPGAPRQKTKAWRSAPSSSTWVPARFTRTVKKYRSPPVSSRCSRPWCATLDSPCHAKSWRNWHAAGNSSPSTAVWTYRFHACAS